MIEISNATANDEGFGSALSQPYRFTLYTEKPRPAPGRRIRIVWPVNSWRWFDLHHFPFSTNDSLQVGKGLGEDGGIDSTIEWHAQGALVVRG